MLCSHVVDTRNMDALTLHHARMYTQTCCKWHHKSILPWAMLFVCLLWYSRWHGIQTGWPLCLSTKAKDWPMDMLEQIAALFNGFLLLNEVSQEFKSMGAQSKTWCARILQWTIAAADQTARHDVMGQLVFYTIYSTLSFGSLANPTYWFLI